MARHPDNKRWATVDGGGEAILLVGPHTWDNGQDMDAPNPSVKKNFDNPKYLKLLDDHGNNFIRLWMFEGFEEGCLPAKALPTVWQETGNNVYDLTDRNPAYINRVVDRVDKAAGKNILVSVMLFQKHSLFENAAGNAASAWHLEGNENEINGGNQDILHTRDVPDPDAKLQQLNYVDELVAALYGKDNIMWEVGNEITADGSAAGDNDGTLWQKDIVEKIRDKETSLGGIRHLITVNSGFGSGGATYDELVSITGADSVAYPNGSSGEYEVDPSDLDPNILTFADTDHLKPVLFSNTPPGCKGRLGVEELPCGNAPDPYGGHAESLP